MLIERNSASGVYRSSDVDDVEECRASQTEPNHVTCHVTCNMSSRRLQQLSDDDGYDVIVDDTSDDCADVFDDSFARREVNRL